MFSNSMSKGWVQIASKIIETNYTQTGLTPSATYIFIVRAENFHGLSPPSPMSESVITGQVKNLLIFSIFTRF